MTAPSGARLPRSTAVPVPAGWKGWPSGMMTSRFQQGASATFSPTVLRVTVSAPACSRSPSSRMTAGRPPA